jgi:hypothetical protein
MANTRPYSDRFAWGNVLIWGAQAVILLPGIIGMNLLLGGSPIWLVFMGINLIFDVRMFMWTLQGMAYRRAVRRQRKADQEFARIMITEFHGGH